MSKPQIYKIYINEVEVVLKPSSDINREDVMKENSVVARYSGKKKQLINFISLRESGERSERLVIHNEDFTKLKSDFKSCFTEIKAAGGLVKNDKNEFLFIFRRGSWDLPKGKIEDNEQKKEAAAREIKEETGLKKLKVFNKIMVTRHTYRSNVGKRIIKKTYWYYCEARSQNLVPQKNEDIEKAEWMTLDTFFSKKRIVYPNILEVIKSYDALNHTENIKIKIK